MPNPITYCFRNVQLRNVFVDKSFPHRHETNVPGVYSLPGGKTLKVDGLSVAIYDKGLKVVSIEMAGYAYHNGRRCPGWTMATLETGQRIYLGDDTIAGFDGAADAADKLGFDTEEYRQRLDAWVKTGKFPSTGD